MAYEEIAGRRVADEQVRAFVGERLTEAPADAIDGLSPQERLRYDRVLLRCEFFNEAVFEIFDRNPTPSRIAAVKEADAALVDIAKDLENVKNGALDGILQRLEEAFDRRDAAMTQA